MVMRKFEAWESVNDGEWEQASNSEPFEAENEKEALELYIDSIRDILEALEAKRVYIEYPHSAIFQYPHSATFQYVNEAGTGITTIDFKVTEVEE